MEAKLKLNANDCACCGCGAKLSKYEALRWGVCMACTRARHRAACTRGNPCTCGRKRRPKRVDYGFRAEVRCERCLGITAERAYGSRERRPDESWNEFRKRVPMPGRGLY